MLADNWAQVTNNYRKDKIREVKCEAKIHTSSSC